MMDDELAQALIGIGCLLFIGIVGSIFWKAATCDARWTDYPHRLSRPVLDRWPRCRQSAGSRSQ